MCYSPYLPVRLFGTVVYNCAIVHVLSILLNKILCQVFPAVSLLVLVPVCVDKLYLHIILSIILYYIVLYWYLTTRLKLLDSLLQEIFHMKMQNGTVCGLLQIGASMVE